MQFINKGNIKMTGDLSGTLESSGIYHTFEKLQEHFGVSGMNAIQQATQILGHEQTCKEYMNILLEDVDPQGDATQSMLNESANNNTIVKGFGEQNATRNYDILTKLMENAKDQMLSEGAVSGAIYPHLGLTLPLLKLYYIKNVYKDIIPTEVAPDFSWEVGIERPYILDKDRNKHYLPDAYYEEGIDLFESARPKLTEEPLALPLDNYDVLTASGGSLQNNDSIDVLLYISEIKFKPLPDMLEGAEQAQPEDKILKNLRVKVDPADGSFKYPIHYTRKIDGVETDYIADKIYGDIDFETGRLNAASLKGKVSYIKLDGHLSTENHAYVMSTGWDKKTKKFVIPTSEHLSTAISKERMKRDQIVYHVDTATKATIDMQNALGRLKEFKIKKFLDESKERIKSQPGQKLFRSATFDLKPPSTLQDPIQWKANLKYALNRLSILVTKILNIENIRFVVMGSQLAVDHLDNVNWMYGKETEVGGINIGYRFGLYNNNKSFYIVSTDLKKDNDDVLQLLMFPTSGDYMTYKLFEFQFCIFNGYRTDENLRQEAVSAFDNYLIDELIPVQAELNLQNNTVSVSEMYS